jgi:hypothetical protein
MTAIDKKPLAEVKGKHASKKPLVPRKDNQPGKLGKKLAMTQVSTSPSKHDGTEQGQQQTAELRRAVVFFCIIAHSSHRAVDQERQYIRSHGQHRPRSTQDRAAWIAAGHRCELVTVIKTWGSSPRPVGATACHLRRRPVVGSVSGGCIEDDLIDRVRQHGITRTTPEVVSYGISADEAHRFGLPCGGTIELAIEPLSRAAPSPNCWPGSTGTNWWHAGSTCAAAP